MIDATNEIHGDWLSCLDQKLELEGCPSVTAENPCSWPFLAASTLENKKCFKKSVATMSSSIDLEMPVCSKSTHYQNLVFLGVQEATCLFFPSWCRGNESEYDETYNVGMLIVPSFW